MIPAARTVAGKKGKKYYLKKKAYKDYQFTKKNPNVRKS
jgi:hypothetical protein